MPEQTQTQTQTQTKKSSSSKKSSSKKKSNTNSTANSTPQSQQYDLTKPQKIVLNKENHHLLYGFVDGTFPEILAPPDTLERVRPEVCPFCRFAGGYELHSNEPIEVPGKYRRDDGKMYGNWSHRVRCLRCGEDYRASETWSFEVKIER